jgi:acetyl esterase/lipase
VPTALGHLLASSWTFAGWVDGTWNVYYIDFCALTFVGSVNEAEKPGMPKRVSYLLFSLLWVSVGSARAGEPVFPALVSVDRNVIYGSEQELMHRADIYRPRSIRGSTESVKEPLPAVVFIHGGAWTLGDKLNDAVHAKKLAARGYCVLSINYRLAPKYRFPAQLEDCKLALQWLAANADLLGVDSKRIGIWGYSAGGHLSALLALEADASTPRPVACVSGGAPFDLTRFPPDTQTLSGVFGGTPRSLPDVYRKASPIVHVSEDDPPMFLFHGSKDWLVSDENSNAMKQRLEEAKVAFEYVSVPNKGHLATFVDMETVERSFDFFDVYLRPDSAWRRDGSSSK